MGKKRVIKKSGDTSGQSGETRPAHSVSAKSSHGKIVRGIAFVKATYNNTMITIADDEGNVLGWASAGALGFSGAKKATPFAAARVAEAVAEKIKKTGMQEVRVLVKGVGSGRDSAVRALANHGLAIMGIKDITPIPHNGPRPKKVRRV
ncbi:MAG: 30S ribosomal protein S11 [Parcubacteria group bacterium Gr01-1014_33]|nr:MAG: 30S ribosomal protein S11 [Parcubacteria group bacterium Gr01-1014_33]